MTLRETSAYLTSMFPADPYSRDPVRLALMAQSAAAAGNASLCGTAVPGSLLLGDLMSRRATQAGGGAAGALQLAATAGVGGGDNQGGGSGAALVVPSLDLAGAFAAQVQEPDLAGAASAAASPGRQPLHSSRSDAAEQQQLATRMSVVQAVLEVTQGASTFTPRAGRRGVKLQVKRPPRSLSPDLQASLAPGQPVHALSRLVTPVRKPITHNVGTSPHSAWGRAPAAAAAGGGKE